MRAITGGRDTVEEQREKGGEPEKCMVFELYKQHLIEDDQELQNVYDNCKAGELTCGECKKNCCSLMNQFMDDFNQKREEAKKNIDKLNFIKFK